MCLLFVEWWTWEEFEVGAGAVVVSGLHRVAGSMRPRWWAAPAMFVFPCGLGLGGAWKPIDKPLVPSISLASVAFIVRGKERWTWDEWLSISTGLQWSGTRVPHV